MSTEFDLTISIPSDEEGYVLLQCPNCGTYFKLTPADIKDDGVLEVFCPSCGLISENYITEDVNELAVAMVKNKAMEIIHKEFKRIEHKFSNGAVVFKAGMRPKQEYESPINSGIEALEETYFPCCKRYAKIKPLLKTTGCYCPFCGLKNYELE